MMRIQYEEIIQKLYKMIDEELEMDTEEGSRAFRELGNALFQVYLKGKKNEN
jgi:hypothetical protein